MITQGSSRTKKSGGLRRTIGKPKMDNIGRLPANTKVGETKISLKRVRGANYKYPLLQADTANVMGKDKKSKKVKITAVLENPANRNFVRRNLLTKGTVIETEAGKARVTSRPGQDGTVNAILL